MARDQHSRVYSCILLTTLAPRCLFTGTPPSRSLYLGSWGEPGHTQTHETHTGHAGAQGHSTGLYMCPVCVPAPPVTGTCLFTGTGTGTGVSWFPCVSRLPPVFTRYRYRSVLFTGTCTVLYRLSRLPPVSFYRYRVPVVSFYR
jgi:hypothetical protein